MATIKNGSDKLLVFGTYAAPSTGSGVGTMTGCRVLAMETNNTLERSYETETIKYKGGLSISLADGRSTVEEDMINAIKYSISGSCYVKAGTPGTGEVSSDMLRAMADLATTDSGTKTVAVISRPATITSPTGSTDQDKIDNLVSQWIGSDGKGADIILPVRVSSYSEPSEAGQLVKCDVTFSQAGEVLWKYNASWS